MRTKIPATLDHLDQALEFIRKKASQALKSPKDCADVELACEEALVNIITHGYESARGTIEIECTHKGAARFTISIKDSARPYNPLRATPLPNHCGTTLMKALVDSIEYERVANTNILKLHKEV